MAALVKIRPQPWLVACLLLEAGVLIWHMYDRHFLCQELDSALTNRASAKALYDSEQSRLNSLVTPKQANRTKAEPRVISAQPDLVASLFALARSSGSTVRSFRVTALATPGIGVDLVLLCPDTAAYLGFLEQCRLRLGARSSVDRLEVFASPREVRVMLSITKVGVRPD